MSETQTAAAEGAVTKPVAQPAKATKPRTGPRPVTKAEVGPRPVKPPKEPKVRAPKMSKEERQRIKFLIQRPEERVLLDKLLRATVEGGVFELTDDDRKVADKMWTRSQARR